MKPGMKVADLTLDELEQVIKRIISDTLAELADETDLEFRDDFVAEINERVANPVPLVSAEEARRILGIDP